MNKHFHFKTDVYVSTFFSDAITPKMIDIFASDLYITTFKNSVLQMSKFGEFKPSRKVRKDDYRFLMRSLSRISDLIIRHNLKNNQTCKSYSNQHSIIDKYYTF